MIVWYAVLKLWGLVSPFLGPLLLAGRGLLPVLNLGRFVMPLAAVAVAGFIAWAAWGMFTTDRPPTMVSIDAVELNRVKAELKAERAAHEQARATLAERLADLETDRIALNRLETELESSRERSENANPSLSRNGVLSADDPWLRGKLKDR
tara:strand:+ start:20516 stop:20968 length:453 start_codon:yes stop_codon:yes gene_type:complete